MNFIDKNVKNSGGPGKGAPYGRESPAVRSAIRDRSPVLEFTASWQCAYPSNNAGNAAVVPTFFIRPFYTCRSPAEFFETLDPFRTPTFRTRRKDRARLEFTNLLSQNYYDTTLLDS
ncbi:hypothetical protein WA026_007916 [Henosepilachna vigintioctopunctata]|uniref:Uncharacterized protein n=1 Tax=Henosepilachna vigintioctopunctata TaxID=420089 RepID=A0AAW1U4B3_9CUCU